MSDRLRRVHFGFGSGDGRVSRLRRGVASNEAVVSPGACTLHRWTLSLRFHAAADATAFQRACNEEGIALDITTVHELRRSEAGADSESAGATLTAPQRGVLIAAVEEGYFAVPRRTTLVEIAEGIRVSDQAVSERLRRALLKPSTPAVGSDTDE